MPAIESDYYTIVPNESSSSGNFVTKYERDLLEKFVSWSKTTHFNQDTFSIDADDLRRKCDNYIGCRSEDFFTLLDFIMNGTIPTKPHERYREKEIAGALYYTHFQGNTLKPTIEVAEIVKLNKFSYGRIARIAPLLRAVSPMLNRTELALYLEKKYESEEGCMYYEWFLNQVARECQNPQADARLKNRFQFLNTLARYLTIEEPYDTINKLMLAFRNRVSTTIVISITALEVYTSKVAPEMQEIESYLLAPAGVDMKHIFGVDFRDHLELWMYECGIECL